MLPQWICAAMKDLKIQEHSWISAVLTVWCIVFVAVSGEGVTGARLDTSPGSWVQNDIAILKEILCIPTRDYMIIAVDIASGKGSDIYQEKCEWSG